MQKKHDQINLQEISLLRIWQIVGDKKKKIHPLIPIGRTTFLEGVKTGKFPKPIKLGERTVAWRAADIIALIEKLGSAA